MSLESELQKRSGARCELCGSAETLSVYDVLPNDGPSPDTSALLCTICSSHAATPRAVAIKHWLGLHESMWSEHPPVKVLAYRVLKGLDGDVWANDLASQLYLDEAQQAWADAGLMPLQEAAPKVLDSNGTQLNEGDTVTIIKDLEVKGANFTAKRGTTVKNISLTDDPRLIEGRVNGTRIVLVAAYLKKA